MNEQNNVETKKDKTSKEKVFARYAKWLAGGVIAVTVVVVATVKILGDKKYVEVDTNQETEEEDKQE